MQKKIEIVAEVGKNFIFQQGMRMEECLIAAKKLTRLAASAGADIVKFQTHVYEDEMKKRSPVRYPWIKENERLTPLKEFWIPLKAYCDEVGVEFLSTPMSKRAAEKIDKLVKRWKIGSADIVDRGLLQYIKATGKPIIMSTGMSNMNQVVLAFESLLGSGLTILHCVSIYPCPVEFLNLNTIKVLKDKFLGHRIGFSDHSLSLVAPALAVRLGAVMIEKHFTASRRAPYGPDHKCSLEPDEFREMVQNIEMAKHEKLVYGTEQKILRPEEEEFHKNFRV